MVAQQFLELLVMVRIRVSQQIKFKNEDSYLKVGDLLKLIKDNNISEYDSVCYRRIEDSYFKTSIWNGVGGSKELDGWKTIKFCVL